jgi:(p)ppGpp synthase/HD superfamily hydrolase
MDYFLSPATNRNSAARRTQVYLFCLLITLVLTSCSTSSNERKYSSQKTSDEIVTDLRVLLILSPEKTKKVRKIIENNMDKRKSLKRKMREGESEKGESLREQMQALQMETDVLMAKVLSPEQMKRYRKYMQEKKEQRGKRSGGKGSGGRKGGGMRGGGMW